MAGVLNWGEWIDECPNLRLVKHLMDDIFTTASDLTLPHILIYSRTPGPKHWIIIVTFACFLGHRRPESQSNSSLDYVVHHKTLYIFPWFYFMLKPTLGIKDEKIMKCLVNTYSWKSLLRRVSFVSQKFTRARSIDLISYILFKTEQNNNFKKIVYRLIFIQK